MGELVGVATDKVVGESEVINDIPLPSAVSSARKGVADVHVTGLRSFLRCRKQWHYRYERGLEPLGLGPKSWGTGSLFHAGMRAIYTVLKESGAQPGDLDVDQAMDHALPAMMQEQVERGGDGDLAEKMVRYYWEHQGRKDTYDRIVQVELPLRAKLDDETDLVGTMDLVLERGGRIVIRDYKTVETLDTDENYIRLDFQFQAYGWLANLHYGKPVELEIHQVRREVPRELTATGRPSKTINNPPSKYIKCIPWFYSTEALGRFGDRVLGVQQDIRAARLSGSWPRTDSHHGGLSCASCPYNLLCGDELLYGDRDDKDLEMFYRKVQHETNDTTA